jgi:sugar O-acyltransferase (sialic acid O-acetyltransferase NeuD family)
MICPGASSLPGLAARAMTRARDAALPVLVLGGGGHARVLVEVLRASGRTIIGIADPALAPGSLGPGGLSVLGGKDVIDKFEPHDIAVVNGVGSTDSMAMRDETYRRISARGFGFIGVVHTSAIVSPSAQLGDGVQLMAGAIIQCNTVIGANSIINTGACVDHDCRIGESVHIAPGATLSGSVTVGDRTHIGTAAAVIQGISIGCDCLVAAGAVVYRNLSDTERLIKQR